MSVEKGQHRTDYSYAKLSVMSEEMLERVTQWFQEYSSSSRDATGSRLSNEDVEALKEAFRSGFEAQSAWRPDPVDPFSFSTKVLTPHASSNHVLTVGHLDSKCKDNWVSANVVSRTGL